jgi:4-amino-4-deoxy-L-arabinose transferase-like glycosyltransferase
VAAAIVAINPFLIYFSGLILSETLFTAMLTWGMLLLVGSSERDGPAWLRRAHPLLGGVVLALAVLVRPSGIGLPVVLGIVAALLNRRSRGAYPGWWPFPPGTTMLLFTVLALAPWAYRNSHVLGQWIWTTTNAGITAYDGFNDDATGASDQRFALKVPGILRADELQRNEFFEQEASTWVKHHPRRALELAVRKIIRTWSPVPLSAEYGKPLYRWIGGLYAAPLYVMVVLGLCFGSLPRGGKVYLLIAAIYITAVHAMSVGSLRYRLPAEPVMAILAVAGCQLLVARTARHVRWGESPSSLATDN